MTIHLGDVPAGSTLYIPFCSYDANGASVTLTGLAATDIEIYKNGSVTQRSSDAGYALLDTDGIDFDGVTGLHGFSIDLNDNTDAGFYSVGGFYWVVVSTVTIATQTVTLLAATFRIVAAESSAGVPKADVSHIAGSAVSTSSAQIGVNVVNAGGTAWGSGAITAAAIADGAIDAGAIASDAITAAKLASDVATEIAGGVLTTQMTEAYAANGVAPTLAQSVFAIHQLLMQMSISGTSLTVKKLDNSTTAFVVTLNDATAPTGAARV
jgi:hypothetical protein